MRMTTNKTSDAMKDSPLAQVLAEGGIEWGSLTTAQKNRAITAAIVSGMKAGVDVRTAYETVLGAGSFEQMASAVYRGIRAKVTA